MFREARQERVAEVAGFQHRLAKSIAASKLNCANSQLALHRSFFQMGFTRTNGHPIPTLKHFSCRPDQRELSRMVGYAHEQACNLR